VAVNDRTTAAWLLLAVSSVSRERPAELWEVMGAADWINHAPLLDEEIELGVDLLSRSGLVSVTEDLLFELTPNGRALVERCESRSLHRMWDRLTDALPQLQPRDGSSWRLDANAAREADRRYRSDIRRR
jgi:hypothetical protein